MKKNKLVKKLSKKKNLKGNDIIELYEHLSLNERNYADNLFKDFLGLEKDWDEFEIEYLSEYRAKKLYKELSLKYGKDQNIITESLYDEDKLQILKKAFEIYNLVELIDKLKITQMEAMI